MPKTKWTYKPTRDYKIVGGLDELPKTQIPPEAAVTFLRSMSDAWRKTPKHENESSNIKESPIPIKTKLSPYYIGRETISEDELKSIMNEAVKDRNLSTGDILTLKEMEKFQEEYKLSNIRRLHAQAP